MKAVFIAAILLIASLGAAWSRTGQDPTAQPASTLDSNALVEGLQAVEGCLGVESAMTRSGKAVIFAWFKDKDAVLDWYYSDTHQEAIAHFMTGGYTASHEPLAQIPDGTGPILCIASVTPDVARKVPGVDLAIRQISIELYTPLPGGLSLGGTFAPAGMEIPGHVRADPPKASSSE